MNDIPPMLPAELPDELPEEIADGIMGIVMSLTAFLNQRKSMPPFGPIAVRAWLKIWESKELDENDTAAAVEVLLKAEWRKEIAAIKKRTVV